MPIITRKSKREGYKPFVFFRGTLKGARQQGEKSILKAFNAARPSDVQPLKNTEETLSAIRGFKRTILDHMQAMAENPPEEKRAEKFILVSTPFGFVPLKIGLNPDKRFLVHQYPNLHTILQGIPFIRLKEVLAEGFKKRNLPLSPNFDNVFNTKDRTGRYRLYYPSEEKDTRGDIYSLELMATHPHRIGEKEYPQSGLVTSVSKNQITRVNIHLDPFLSKEETKTRMAFYRRELKQFTDDGHKIRFLHRGQQE